MIRNRRYQDQIIRSVESLFAENNGRVLIQCPTGAGKTIIAVQLVDRAALRRVLYIVPSAEIFEQTSDKLDRLGIPHVCLNAGARPKLDSTRVVLAMSQTLANRRHSPMWADWAPELIIIDEVHRLIDQHKKILGIWNVPVIGMTATPVRLDGKSISDICPYLVLGPSIGELQAGGFLVPAVTYIAEIPDLKHVRRRRTEYDSVEVEQAYIDSGVLDLVPQSWLRYADGRRTITFAPGVDSSRMLVAAYKARGIRAVHIDSLSTTDARNKALQDLRDHKIDVLCNVGLFIEGLDLIETECITLCRPTHSVAYHVQSIGRGLRPAAHINKKSLVVIDHSGNCLRHGVIEAPRDWARGGVFHSQRLKVCRACRAVVSRKSPWCSFCGFEEKENRVSDVARRRNARRRSLNIKPRTCPLWAVKLKTLWFKCEERRARYGLPLPDPDLGERGYTESVVSRRLEAADGNVDDGVPRQVTG